MDVLITILGTFENLQQLFWAKIINFRMISSDYSSEDDEVEDESLVLQPSKKLPVIIFRPEVSRMSFNHLASDCSLKLR